jgi:hypothetical protein
MTELAACDGLRSVISPWLPRSICVDCQRRIIAMRSEMSAQWIEPAIKVERDRTVCDNRVVTK